MADAFVERAEAVKKLLARLDGSDRENQARVQASTLKKIVAEIKGLSLETAADMETKLNEIGFSKDITDSLLAAINAKIVLGKGSAVRRPSQSMLEMSNYLTEPLVGDLTESNLAYHLNALGLVNPCEHTMGKAAALLAVHKWGDQALALPQYVLQDLYSRMKKKIKELFKSEPLEYVAIYPPTPLEFLDTNPILCQSVFNMQKLPIECPYSEALLNAVFGRIKLRGWVLSAGEAEMQRWCALTSPSPSLSPSPPPARKPPAQSESATSFQAQLELQSFPPLALEQGSQATPSEKPPNSEKFSKNDLPLKPDDPPTKAVAATLDVIARKSKAERTKGKKNTKEKGKGKGKGKGKAKRLAMKKKKTKKVMKAVKKKPAKYLKLFPHGCCKCRNVKGCTPSCWKLYEAKKGKHK